MKKRTLLALILMMLCVAIAFTSCGDTNENPGGGIENGGTENGGGTENSDAEITGITFAGAEFTYDGTEKSIAIAGTLPEGVSVAYANEKATNAGTYSATATLSGEGYKTKTLTATLKINKADITGITFTGAEHTYDGAEKSIAITGTLPAGTEVSYTDAKATNAGTYNAVATVSGANYNTLTLNATLKINKADITGITAEAEQNVLHDGEYHFPAINGTLPAGATVKYLFDGVESADGVRTVGTHAATIVIGGANYNELTLEVSFKIKMNFAGLANNVIDSFGSVPDVWAFLPESFSAESRSVAYTSSIDYSSFVNVEDIPVNGMGKQLNMVYGILTKAETALAVVNTVYGGMNTIYGLYSAYLDSNPADYQHFEGNAGPFTFTLDLGDNEYAMTANVGSVQIVISSQPAENTYGARIQLTDTTVLKYVVEDSSLTLAIDILGTASAMIEFVREDDVVTGYVYENLTALGKDLISTSAMITVGETYTTIIGTKGDFIPASDSRNCEIYLNSNGRLVGTKVRENVDIKFTTVTFDTFWFPLYKLEGVDTIKIIEEKNDLNANSIYINGSSDLLEAMKIGGGILNLKSQSRRYDIEVKTMYFYNYDSDKDEYVSIELEIPMLFVQEDNFETFEDDFNSLNSGALDADAQLIVSIFDIAATEFAYTEILPAYDLIKDLVSSDMIKEFCGIVTEDTE